MQATRVIILDWDGTLVDSMATKALCFGIVVGAFLQRLGSTHDQGMLEALYLKHSGIPRHAVLAAMLQDLGHSACPAAIGRLSEEIGNQYRSRSASVSLFADAARFIEWAIAREYVLWISSSVPPAELTGVVNALLPARIRSAVGVLGSEAGFSKGPDHVDFITKSIRVERSGCLMVGDDAADLALAQSAGVRAVLVDRRNAFEGLAALRVTTLEEIKDFL